MTDMSDDAREDGPSPDPLADQAGVAADGIRRLWAPWRAAYVDGQDPIDGCPFCVLPARGPGLDRDSLILFRGEHVYVIMNAYPYNPGHVMVIPFAHHGDLANLDDAASDELWRVTRRAVDAVAATLSADGVNVGMNLGRAAGAGIADHLHQHVVPRWCGDTNFMSSVGASRVLPHALRDLYDVIVAGFAPTE